MQSYMFLVVIRSIGSQVPEKYFELIRHPSGGEPLDVYVLHVDFCKLC